VDIQSGSNTMDHYFATACNYHAKLMQQQVKKGSKLLHEPRTLTQSLKLELGMGKCFFSYTHASKTQEFNHKMNVI
jgi:hypothetical protein